MEYLGIRASGGPLVDTALELRPGLNVLYGQNGAGKTRLLAALQSALTGEWRRPDGAPPESRGDVVLFVRFDEGELDERGPLAREWPNPENALSVVPYRESDLPVIEGVMAEAQASRVLALSPSNKPGSGWTVTKAVGLAEGSASRMLFELDNEIVDYVRSMVLGRPERVAELDEKLGFNAVPTDIPSLVEALDFLFTRRHDPGEVLDRWIMTDGPSDNLPLAMYPANRWPDDGQEEFWGPWKPAYVITATRIEDLQRAVADAFGEGLRGALFLGDSGWVPASDQRKWVRDQWAKAGLSEEIMEQLTSDSIVVGKLFDDWLPAVTDLANRLVAHFLLDPPELSSSRSTNVMDLLRGDAVVWKADDGIELASLSTAEFRWVSIALRLAFAATVRSAQVPDLPSMAPTPDRLGLPKSTFLLIDEPEVALHRTAEAHMAAALANLARHQDFYVVVATHSPHVMDVPSAAVKRVHRRSRSYVHLEDSDNPTTTLRVCQVTELDDVGRENLRELGLEPSDLLRRQKVILLVEGQHDEQVLRHFLSEDLRAARAEFVNLRGGSNLAGAMEGRVLIDFTDATLLCVLDNLRRDHVADVWSQAQLLAATQGHQTAGDFLRGQLPAKASSENKYLQGFLSRALELGLDSRISVFPLSRKDILMYLSVREFMPKAQSWKEVLSDHSAALANGATKITDWKLWAQKVLNARFDTETISRALTACDQIPEGR